jgi:hypothetical protein
LLALLNQGGSCGYKKIAGNRQFSWTTGNCRQDFFLQEREQQQNQQAGQVIPAANQEKGIEIEQLRQGLSIKTAGA